MASGSPGCAVLVKSRNAKPSVTWRSRKLGTSWLANPTRVSDLSLRGLKRLLKPPAEKSARSKKARRQKPLGKLDPHAVLGWFNSAPIEEQQRLFDTLGARAIAAATPPSWRKDDTGPASAGEIARLNARVEELQREVRQRDLTIAGLRRELGMPVDDGLDIPTFLRRLPPPDALESIEAEAESARRQSPTCAPSSDTI